MSAIIRLLAVAVLAAIGALCGAFIANVVGECSRPLLEGEHPKQATGLIARIFIPIGFVVGALVGGTSASVLMTRPNPSHKNAAESPPSAP